MFKIIVRSFILLIYLSFLYSCKNDDASVLSITNIVAGNHEGEGNQVPLGGTINIDFDATAGTDARLDYYHIELHDHPESGLSEDEFRIIDQTFENESTFKGLRNASVHKHVPVPLDANVGAYHVVIVVVDEQGNSADTEEGNTEVIVIE